MDRFEDIRPNMVEVSVFWDLILDTIMETVEGPMRSELLQNSSFWANQVREILEGSDGAEMTEILLTNDSHSNPLHKTAPSKQAPQAGGEGAPSSSSSQDLNMKEVKRENEDFFQPDWDSIPLDPNNEEDAKENREAYLPQWATLRTFLSRGFWRHQLQKALMHPGQQTGGSRNGGTRRKPSLFSKALQ